MNATVKLLFYDGKVTILNCKNDFSAKNKNKIASFLNSPGIYLIVEDSPFREVRSFLFIFCKKIIFLIRNHNVLIKK